MTTNEWHIAADSEEYLDIEKELISFADEGNSSVDLRLTFDKAAHSAYMVLMRRNDDGNTNDGLLPKEISMTWEEAIAYLGDAARLLQSGVIAPKAIPAPIDSTDKANTFLEKFSHGEIDIYTSGTNEGPIHTAAIFDSDQEDVFCEARGINIDDVAEWVGLHYKRNFDVESAEKRFEWLCRYAESIEFDVQAPPGSRV